jgi:hypothetical protein
MTRTYLVVGLALSLLACKSKEEQACRSQEKWVAEINEALDRSPEPLTKDKLAECVANQKEDKERFSLDDAGYEALLDCRIAAKNMDEGLACLAPVMEAMMKKSMDDAKREIDAKAAPH